LSPPFKKHLCDIDPVLVMGSTQLQESLDSVGCAEKDFDPAFSTMAVDHLLFATVSVFITLTFLML
jgi:hypothetical protein